MNILVTGCAGFIGWKVSQKLLEQGHTVIGVDNLNDYNDVRIKEYRLSTLKENKNFTFYYVDIEDLQGLRDVFKNHKIDAVINEAARAGVRYSVENPFVYFTTNVNGLLNILELCKEFGVSKIVHASTSSLYAGQPMPFKEDLPVNTPISPYAASKKASEVLCYTYHYLYGIDVSIVRYFTVYGPAGRPDMGVFRFVRWIMEGSPIQLYGDGMQTRDFTYIDDIAEGTVNALKPLGYQIINLGNNKPHTVLEYIQIAERYIGKKAIIKNLEFPKVDMQGTWADIDKAKELLDWYPKVSLEEGLERMVKWFKDNWNWVKDLKL